MLKPRASGSWTPGPPAPGLWSSDIESPMKLRIHYKITCETHKRVFLGFWIAKPMSSPARGMESPVVCVWYENLLWNYIRSKLIKLQFNIITNMLKKHDREDMIKTETWSDHVNFTLRNRFSWTFKVLKPMSFRGLGPLDPCQGRCPWTPPGALGRAPGSHPCWASRQAAHSAGYARTLFPF